MQTNRSNRSALFTSRDTENAILWFTITGVLLIILVVFDVIFSEKQRGVAILRATLKDMPQVLALATTLTIFKEGVDIMLTRYRASRERERKAVQKARQEAQAEAQAKAQQEIERARAEAYEQGYNDGKTGVKKKV